MNATNFQIERQPEAVIKDLEKIQELADLEKNAIGFWPKQQLKDAIKRRRLWTLLQGGILKGFLIYSGSFPNAKIQAIATTNSARKQGVAACLMRSFISEMELQGFILIKAEVASDLRNALNFYSSQGFQQQAIKKGGSSRNRTILVHIRELETDTLFSFANKSNTKIDLGIRRRKPNESPFYALDLNVYLDLVKNREQSENAGILFSAALGHQIRLAVTKEFVEELKRNSTKAPSNDPLLKLALRLPKIPPADSNELKILASKVHILVFNKEINSNTSTNQSKSDAMHLAHASLSRASAFVTRDGALLAARETLIKSIGIDVIHLTELVDLLPSPENAEETQISSIGQGFRATPVSKTELSNYLASAQVSKIISEEFHLTDEALFETQTIGIREGDNIVAIGVIQIPMEMNPTAKLLIHSKPENPNCELFSDHILNTMTRKACETLPTAILLVHLPGQFVVRALAKSRGYIKSPETNDLHKVAFGRPLTNQNWANACKAIHRRTGLILPNHPPTNFSMPITISNNLKNEYELHPYELENLLSPALIVNPTRSAALVPIQRPYADDLLGTSRQGRFDFIENKDASFKTIRSYVNSPRSASILRPEKPIFFYESQGQNGRGSVVAVARIVDSIIIQKTDIPNNQLKRTVVEEIGTFSSSDEVLLTTFDNLLPLPNPVNLIRLRDIDAIGGANLVSPVTINNEQIAKILSWGWHSEH